MKVIITVAFMLAIAICAFYLGTKHQKNITNHRAIKMILNEELPEDKVAISAIDWIINARTGLELDYEIQQLKKDSIKVKEILNSCDK